MGPVLTSSIMGGVNLTPFPINPEVKAKPELVFSGDKPTDEDEVIAPVVEISYTTVRVRVLKNYRVVHAGKAYVGGDVFDAPANETTSNWQQLGYIERVKESE
jgi:hypothetical protein